MATLDDIAKIQKYSVQRFNRFRVDAAHVLDFHKFKLPIHVRGFHKAFPETVRKRIDMNLQLMGPSLDDFRPNNELSDKILETMEKRGFKNMGVAGERLDLRDMSDETKLMLDKTITSIRKAKLVRKSRADEPLEEFKCYVKSVWGYKLKSHKVRRNGETWHVYSLVDMIPETALQRHVVYNFTSLVRPPPSALALPARRSAWTTAFYTTR